MRAVVVFVALFGFVWASAQADSRSAYETSKDGWSTQHSCKTKDGDRYCWTRSRLIRSGGRHVGNMEYFCEDEEEGTESLLLVYDWRRGMSSDKEELVIPMKWGDGAQTEFHFYSNH